MNHKPAFLLSLARSFELQDIASRYDAESQLNVLTTSAGKVPLVSQGGYGLTDSKTFAAPSDDDPDPDDERCY